MKSRDCPFVGDQNFWDWLCENHFSIGLEGGQVSFPWFREGTSLFVMSPQLPMKTRLNRTLIIYWDAIERS